MSTLSSKVAALERHRRAVARELAAFVVPPGPAPIAGGLVEAGRADAILAGALHFDVHAAREHARALVALADEQAVFEDWTRAKGLGPENREPGAHHEPWRTWVVDIDKAAAGVWGLVVDGITVQSEDFYATASASSISGYLSEAESKHDIWPDSPNAVVVEGLVSSVELRAPVDGEYSITCVSEVRIDGGWPGKLAREWAKALDCDHVDADSGHSCVDGLMTVHWPEDPNPPCPKCSNARARRRRASMGRSLARLGRRILDMLEGQASECQGCDGAGEKLRRVMGRARLAGCAQCQGTGHNLRGKLPEVEWSPPVRRKAADEAISRYAERRSFDADPLTPGIRIWQDGGKRSIWPYITRVCPRGDHRTRRSNFSVFLAEEWPADSSLDERITARAESGVYVMDGCWSHLPNWRRGEWTAELQGTIVE